MDPTTLSTPSTPSLTTLEAFSFKHRRVGRCPSPPVWGCYELEVNESDSDNSSQSGSDDEEGISIIVASEVDPVNIPLPQSPVPNVIPMDTESPQTPAALDAGSGAAAAGASDSPSDAAPAVAVDEKLGTPDSQEAQDVQDESCTDYASQKVDKGKGREVVDDSPQSSATSATQDCSPQTPSSRAERRAARAQRRTPKYQPILTIRSSHGWIWNQDLFVPHYMKDRYISYPPEQPSSETPGSDFDCVGITLTADDLSQALPP